jgi:hypothetical protein
MKYRSSKCTNLNTDTNNTQNNSTKSQTNEEDIQRKTVRFWAFSDATTKQQKPTLNATQNKENKTHKQKIKIEIQIDIPKKSKPKKEPSKKSKKNQSSPIPEYKMINGTIVMLKKSMDSQKGQDKTSNKKSQDDKISSRVRLKIIKDPSRQHGYNYHSKATNSKPPLKNNKTVKTKTKYQYI